MLYAFRNQKHLTVRLDRSPYVCMRVHPLGLRRKVVGDIIRKMPKAEDACTFGIGISTVKRYMVKARKGEDLAPRRPPDARGFFEHCGYRLAAQ